MNAKLQPAFAAASLAVIALIGLGAGGAAQAADVGVSVSISQPGVYGRIDIGRFPQPAVIVNQPIIVQRVVQVREPVYMWVPPGHRKNWSKHCGQYGACGAPVYFVSDGWYDQNVRHASGPRNDWRHDDRKHKGKHDDHRGGRHGRDD